MYCSEKHTNVLSKSLSTSTCRTATLQNLIAVLILLLATFSPAYSHAQGTPGGAIPVTYFSMMFNNSADVQTSPTGANYVTFGLNRVWDSGASWPTLETSSGTYTWTALDTLLQNVKSAGANTAFYTLSRTPNWALGLTGNCSTNPSQPACDQSCNYYGVGGVTTGAGAPGQCYPPSDLNADGSGTNATWKAWVTAVATHANSLSSSSYAQIKYWEIWNEFDRANNNYNSGYINPSGTNNGNSFYGSYAQMVRMAEDARCIIKGKNYITTIHNGGGTCTSNGIDPTAMIVAPSSHSQSTFGLNVVQNFLYCSVSGVTTGSPNYCNTGSDGAAAVDIINFHMKPGNESDGFAVESEMQTEYCAVVGGCAGATGILRSAELAKPFWNGEAGYSGGSGNSWSGKNGAVNLVGNQDMQASFIGRYSLMQWSLGIQSFSWYEYDLSNFLNNTSLPDAPLSYNSMYTWLTGQTMNTSCSNTSGTQWTCGLTGANGFIGQPIWDTSSTYTCNADSVQGNDCTYYYATVATSWHYYRDLWGNETAIPTTGTHAHQVQVSNLPIMLENKKLF